LFGGGTYTWNPYTTNEKGHEPAWTNSLFEYDAEFGFGTYHSVRSRRNNTKTLIEKFLHHRQADVLGKKSLWIL
jgi:pyruvate-ferredoxin/flavodoxin oxidoreductase